MKPSKGPDPLLRDERTMYSLIGNEAICRGAIEADVRYVVGYPGTPSSEVLDTFYRLRRELGISVKYAVNEKTAIELCYAASLSGVRALCSMKHLGLMVGGDPLSTIPYIGVVGGMVIVSAGDPSCHTSPNEQDQRHLGPMLHVPVLDPFNSQEALWATRMAFDLSEHCRLPVLLRVTTRVAHGRSMVRFGPKLPTSNSPVFRSSAAGLVPVPHRARQMRLEIPTRLRIARDLTEDSCLLRRDGAGDTALLAQGAPANIAIDLFQSCEYRGRLSLFVASVAYPIPETFLEHVLTSAKQVLVIEELSPYLEDALFQVAGRLGKSIPIFGKRSGHLSVPFEYQPRQVEAALRRILGMPELPSLNRAEIPVEARPPILCAGCPHRATFVAARAAFDENQLYFNDIGCYTLGYGPPHEVGNALLCMGAGFTLAAGVAEVTGKRTVGFMGDSTFFHSGMPSLLEALQTDANMVLVVLDNQVTAMTGFQQSPSQPGPKKVSIEAVARALGADRVQVVDPFDLAATQSVFREASKQTGVTVIVARQGCPVYQNRGAKTRPEPHFVDENACRKCGREKQGLRCKVPTTIGYERNLARIAAERPKGSVHDIAPCAELCPLGLCIQGYAGHIAAGEFKEAFDHIWDRTALPEIVCRVCDRPCEKTCVRTKLDEAIAINDLKRFVIDHAVRQADNWFSVVCEPPHGRSVAVVGSGPAGLTAANELFRRGYRVALFEARKPGGLLTAGIPHYRLPVAEAERDVKRLLDQGIDLRLGKRLGVDFTLDSLLDEGFVGVVLATGAQRPKTMDLPGDETSPRRQDAVTFLTDFAIAQAEAVASKFDGSGRGDERHSSGGRTSPMDSSSRDADAAAASTLDAVLVTAQVARWPGASRKPAISLSEPENDDGPDGDQADQTAIGSTPGGAAGLCDSPELAEFVAAMSDTGPDAAGTSDASGIFDACRSRVMPTRNPVVWGNLQLDSGQPISSVVVIGGGNAAIDVARTARRLGATSVTVVTVETRSEMPALAEEVANATAEGIDFLHDRRAVKTESTKVCFRQNDRPLEEWLEADCLFFALGQEANLEGLSVGGVALKPTEDGLLWTDETTLQTSHPQIFACGDLASHRRTVTWAMAMGMHAAWALDRVNRGAEKADRRLPSPLVGRGRPPIRLPLLRVPPIVDLRTPIPLQTSLRSRPDLTIPSNFGEVAKTMTEQDARAEAQRCLQCGMCGNCRACIETVACPAFSEREGRISINPSLCTACGVCEKTCSNGAIHPGAKP